MKCLASLIMRILVLVFFFSVFARNAYAYLDPGTGSYILQMIIAALLGGLFAVKLFRYRIKIFFKNLFSRGKKHEKVED